MENMSTVKSDKLISNIKLYSNLHTLNKHLNQRLTGNNLIYSKIPKIRNLLTIVSKAEKTKNQ